MNKIIISKQKKIGEQTPDWSQDGKKLPVYEIPIDKLYFNDDNGRIATLISVYNDTPDVTPLTELNPKDYNDLIHNFIKKSNTPESFKKTYDDIQIKGQINPGVILPDGRIVSGNRRVTVLRELYDNTGNEQFRFFKCFIIDKTMVNKDDRKDIKTIERLTQFGVDERIDYDPIDRLVDIYNDLIGPNKMWTLNEYWKKLSLKKNDAQTMYYKAIVMADYLEYLNKPLKFYIAKEEKLDGPLQEVGSLYKQINAKDEWNRIRVVFYVLFSRKGDRSRAIREHVRLYKKDIDAFNRVLDKINADIEKKEIEQLERLKISDVVTDKEEQIQINLGEVITEETHETIFKEISKSKINVQRQKKVNRFLDALDYVIINYDEILSLADKNEIKRIKEKEERIVIIFKKKQ